MEAEKAGRLEEAPLDPWAELRASEARFRALCGSAPIGILQFDALGRCNGANERAHGVTGLSSREVLGAGWIRAIHPQDRAEVAAEWEAATRLGAEFAREFRLLTPGGMVRHVHARISRLNDAPAEGWIGTLQDLTVHVEGASRLAELKRYQERILDSIADAIIGVDAAGRVVFVNPAAAGLVGRSRADLTARRLDQLLAPRQDGRGTGRGLLDDVLRDGRTVGPRDARLPGPDGTEVPVEYSACPIVEDGDVVGAVVTVRDVRDKTRLERQLVQARKLESGIAHEIDTPTQYIGDGTRVLREAFANLERILEALTPILEAVEQGTVAPDQVETARQVLREADVEFLRQEIPAAIEQSLDGLERMTRIVRAMNEFSHPAAEVHEVDVNRAIQSTINVSRNEWKNVADLSTDFDPSMPKLWCLPGELSQAVRNLIVNAAHAVAEAVGDGATAKGRISVGTRRAGRWLEIRVSDNGVTKGLGRGAGQGLRIVQDVVVDKHGGAIDVATEVGGGSVFTLRLPLEGGATAGQNAQDSNTGAGRDAAPTASR